MQNSSHSWFEWANSAVGVIGVLVGLVTYLLTRRFKRVSAFVDSSSIIERSTKTPPQLRIFYGDAQIHNLRVTKILIKNTGTDSIRYDDLPEKNRFIIRPENDTRILDAVISNSSSDSCNCRLTRNHDGSYGLKFDYLDPQDNVSIQITHTGEHTTGLNIEGRVIGAGPIELLRVDKRNLLIFPLFGAAFAVIYIALTFLFLNSIGAPYFYTGRVWKIGNVLGQTITVVNPKLLSTMNPVIQISPPDGIEVLDGPPGLTVNRTTNGISIYSDLGVAAGGEYTVTYSYTNRPDVLVISKGKLCKDSPTFDRELMERFLFMVVLLNIVLLTLMWGWVLTRIKRQEH